MAISGVSPGDPHAVSAVTECGEYKFGAYPAGAWDPDYPDIGRVLKTAYTR